MRRLSLLILVTCFFIESPAFAEEKKFKYGLQMDLGVPDGATAGLAVKPWVNFARLNLSGAYNMAPGLRGGLTLDPFNFGVAPTLTFEYGKTWHGKPPIVENLPKIGYEYVNAHLGLEFGNRDSWRIFIHGGPTWLWFDTEGFSTVVSSTDKSLQMGEVSGSMRINPCAKIGFVTLF